MFFIFNAIEMFKNLKFSPKIYKTKNPNQQLKQFKIEKNHKLK